MRPSPRYVAIAALGLVFLSDGLVVSLGPGAVPLGALLLTVGLALSVAQVTDAPPWVGRLLTAALPVGGALVVLVVLRLVVLVPFGLGLGGMGVVLVGERPRPVARFVAPGVGALGTAAAGLATGDDTAALLGVVVAVPFLALALRARRAHAA